MISSEPRFIADRMLGRLARYLRLLGYDVSYPPSSSDARLVAMARAEGRVLLTRDRGISLRDGPRAGDPVVVEIRSSEIMSQLAQMVEEGWVDRSLAPRCSLCNAPLEIIEEREARHLLPPFTLATQAFFLYCASCNTVLWEGSHWKHFLSRTMPKLNT